MLATGDLSRERQVSVVVGEETANQMWLGATRLIAPEKSRAYHAASGVTATAPSRGRRFVDQIEHELVTDSWPLRSPGTQS